MMPRFNLTLTNISIVPALVRFVTASSDLMRFRWVSCVSESFAVAVGFVVVR